MAMRQNISPRQQQQLAMTPQLREAIELLQMSHQEISHFVDEQILDNPLLEAAPIPETPLPSGQNQGSGNDMLSRLNNIGRKPSLWEHLDRQISLHASNPRIATLARLMVGELDDDGLLRVSLDEMASQTGAAIGDVQQALALLQSCDPTGIGARDLAECFRLQLLDRNALTPQIDQFLSNVGDFRVKNFDIIREDFTAKGGDFDAILTVLRGLNPSPSNAFDTAQPEFAVPDVFVQRNNLGGWSVELNPAALPRVLMNNDYLNQTNADGETQKFMRDCMARGNWLIKALDQRARTILNVATEITRVQDAFFTSGITHLKPLTLRDVADKIDMHESTVSRVTRGKYLGCERGTFELRYFFSKAISTTPGNAPVAAAVVREKIRRFVEAETLSSILSDDKLVKLLRNDGIIIARRTVTKYREAMQIPSSVERRRFKSGLAKIRT